MELVLQRARAAKRTVVGVVIICKRRRHIAVDAGKAVAQARLVVVRSALISKGMTTIVELVGMFAQVERSASRVFARLMFSRRAGEERIQKQGQGSSWMANGIFTSLGLTESQRFLGARCLL